jgi:hypothetical protein
MTPKGGTHMNDNPTPEQIAEPCRVMGASPYDRDQGALCLTHNRRIRECPIPEQIAEPLSAERIAQRFHEAYERLAPSFGYETRRASAVPWADVPKNNRRLMIAVAAEVLDAIPAKADDGRPEIVCLCGSTRFYDEFQAANYDLTMLGKIVLSVGFYPHALTKSGHGEGVGHDSSEKVALDELHKRKIDLADRVYILNVNGYIGDSTRSEIEYAVAHGKPVDYLEKP